VKERKLSDGRSPNSRACSGCWPTWRWRSMPQGCRFVRRPLAPIHFRIRFSRRRAKITASETANTVTNQALQLFGARDYSRDYPLERMVRNACMFTIAGGTAQVLRRWHPGFSAQKSRRPATGIWRQFRRHPSPQSKPLLRLRPRDHSWLRNTQGGHRTPPRRSEPGSLRCR
jgi:hypothetical protein